MISLGSYRFSYLSIVLALVILMPLNAQADGEIWVLVDTDSHVLSVMRDGKAVARFEHIAIGRGGTSKLRTRGDGSTPLGTYRVAWINEDSPFRRFYGFNFPSLQDGRRALDAGKIKQSDLDGITRAASAGKIPPQNTPLGGRLGIHGLGGGSLKVHQSFNWTQGCIALTNDQIDHLANWITIGTRVVVR